MNRFFAIATVAFTIAAPVAARAGSFTLNCEITDSQGSALTYAFLDNTPTTVVEDYFDKNGKTVLSAIGRRPVWTTSVTPEDTLLIASLEAPGWAITYDPRDGSAYLDHNGREAGRGSCRNPRSAARTRDDLVRDMGN
jgi:hypothetical protein